MGICVSKKESAPDQRHVDSGHHNPNHNHNHKNHEPYANQSKSKATSQHASSTKPVQRSDKNTILGKEFEDVKQFYTIRKELGRGQFGVTYRCTENSTGLKYACKSISKRKLVNKADKEDIKREVQLMQHMSGQPNIVEFKGAYEDRHSVCCSGPPTPFPRVSSPADPQAFTISQKYHKHCHLLSAENSPGLRTPSSLAYLIEFIAVALFIENSVSFLLLISRYFFFLCAQIFSLLFIIPVVPFIMNVVNITEIYSFASTISVGGGGRHGYRDESEKER